MSVHRGIRFWLSLIVLIGQSVLPLFHAQTMIGIGSRYNESFREWIITTDDEDVRGEMRLTWSFRDDWTEWDVRVGDQVGSIRQKWKDDPNLWEVRSGGVTVTARTAWPNVFSRWKISDGRHSFNFGPTMDGYLEEWVTEGNKQHYFQIYTYWEGDPREWVIIDELSDDFSFAMRIAMVFLALFHSTPKV